MVDFWLACIEFETTWSKLSFTCDVKFQVLIQMSESESFETLDLFPFYIILMICYSSVTHYFVCCAAFVCPLSMSILVEETISDF